MLEKQSHQTESLTRLELVTLVALVTLDREILFNRNGDVQKCMALKSKAAKSNVTKTTNVTRAPQKAEAASVHLW